MKDRIGKSTYHILAVAILSMHLSHGAFAQRQTIQYPDQYWLTLAEEQYVQGHYRLSLQSINEFRTRHAVAALGYDMAAAEKADYYSILSQVKLDNDGATEKAEQFILHTAHPIYKQRVALALAQYYFSHDRLDNAIAYYEMVNISNLTNKEIADVKFELAYCYFNNRQFDKAEPLLASIKDLKGKYKVAGNYYYGLLAYNNSRYEEALKSFKEIEHEASYKNIVPYYVAEIYYFMGDKKKALEEALRLTRRPEKIYYDNELHLLAAQVLFEDQRYGDALPYFEHYYENTDQIRKEELYEMAYSYYRVNEWKNAIAKFKPLSNTRDSLGQTAMYLLGDCYLKTGDKKSARNAFSLCADMSFNKKQQEASLLLLGKLSYEMGYNSDAMTSFNNLLVLFPSTSYKNEVKTLQSELLIKTNNYATAYKLLQEVTVKNNDYWKAAQKVTYGYGIQQMQRENYLYADSLLGLSLYKPLDHTYEMSALFWRGDIAYKLGKPGQTLSILKRFVADNGGEAAYLSKDATEGNAYLNMGYAAMDIGSYEEAQTYFGKARQGADAHSSLAVTATIREADAAFMQKNFREALQLYDRSISAGGEEADYAMIQKAILLGVQGKLHDKLVLLQQVVNSAPPSAYVNDARYELGNTYIEDEQYQQAISALMPLTRPEGKGYIVKALQKTGFAYQQLNNDNKAIEFYKRIVAEFPASEERNAALDALRSLYVEHNQPDAYAAFIKENNINPAADNTLDSTYYAAAEAQVAEGKWAAAQKSLATYLEKYPDGIFMVRAHYYKAESDYQLKENQDALKEYDLVLSLPWNEFSESSAKRAATIAYQSGDYASAAKYYNHLRTDAMNKANLELAYSGLMQSNYNLGDYALAAQYADTLLAMPETDENILREVRFYKARSLQQQHKDEEALALFEQVKETKDPSVAAEARYRMAQIYFQSDRLKEAETNAVENLRQSSGNDYWMVKSYLLLADISLKQKDYFNAKATLQSIIKNTKNADLKKEASEKLERVKSLEQQQSKLKEN